MNSSARWVMLLPLPLFEVYVRLHLWALLHLPLFNARLRLQRRIVYLNWCWARSSGR
ncbi:MAG: hypothetical protein F6K28_27795 [Microcoleus sp. SIO2G3]|nr:hypothetical protein [Microcoleus sp. SIO2G3]